MDNLGSHKGTGIQAAIEAAGVSLLYLPHYSPDFEPIENAFAKLKAILRKVAERIADELGNAIGSIIATVTPEESTYYYSESRHNEYCPNPSLNQSQQRSATIVV
jgi:transposase